MKGICLGFAWEMLLKGLWSINYAEREQEGAGKKEEAPKTHRLDKIYAGMAEHDKREFERKAKEVYGIEQKNKIYILEWITFVCTDPSKRYDIGDNIDELDADSRVTKLATDFGPEECAKMEQLFVQIWSYASERYESAKRNGAGGFSRLQPPTREEVQALSKSVDRHG